MEINTKHHQDKGLKMNADTLIKTVLDEVRVVGLYPGSLGANVIEFGKKTQNKVREVPLSDLHNNEIYKDTLYFRKPAMRKYVGALRRSVSKGRLKEPVLGLAHPEKRDQIVVVDGNHRLRAARNARAFKLPVENVPWHQISLVPPGTYSDSQEDAEKICRSPRLSNFVEPDGSFKMYKRRKELGKNPFAPRVSAGRGKKRQQYLSLRDYFPSFQGRDYKSS